MRKIILFIAMSLDGYIADKEGQVGWLEGHGAEEENIDTYSEFIQDIDTVIMGWKTYHQVVTELSPMEWPYRDFTSYVITHKEERDEEKLKFTKEAPAELLYRLKAEEGKDIWICGGANIVGQLMKDGLIDRFHLSIMPVLLGSGVPLFGLLETELKLKLIGSRSYNGITEVIYEKR